MVAAIQPEFGTRTRKRASLRPRCRPCARESGYPRFSPARLGHRFYSANLHTWLSRDPIGEWPDNNIYAFVRNAPSDAIDAIGLVTEDQIRHDKAEYTCNCGWIDWDHAWPRTELWQAIQKEDAPKGSTSFLVYYSESITQDIVPLLPKRWKLAASYYQVLKGLTAQQKESVALAILMDIEEQFEEAQSWRIFGKRGLQSSFAQEDLISDQIGLYRAVRNWDAAKIRKLCNTVGKEKSFDQFKQYKNRPGASWSSPILEACDVCPADSTFPAELQDITAAEEGSIFHRLSFRPK